MSTSVDELNGLLEQIAGEARPVAFSSLFALSDLAGERLKLFLAVWEKLPMPARSLIEALATWPKPALRSTLTPSIATAWTIRTTSCGRLP